MSGEGRTVVWSLPGQAHFARVMARALGCQAHVGGEIPECDAVHIAGMYDCPSFATTLRATSRAKRRIYHWMGPDAVNCFWPERIPAATHVCPSDAIRLALGRRGIEASVVMPPVGARAELRPFAGSPVIAIYGGADPRQYGMSMAKALHECLPGIGFLSYVKGQFAPELMPDVITRARIYLRLRSVADGGVSCREYLAAGRRVVTTDDLEFATRVRRDDLPGVLAAVKEALAAPEPDAEAAAFWTPLNADARFVREMELVLR